MKVFLFSVFLLLPGRQIQAAEVFPLQTTPALAVGPLQQFKTINDAINSARLQNIPCTILIDSGIYYENITILNDTAPITFIGIGDVSVVSDTPYPYSPLYCAGNYSFENMHFVSCSDSAYGLHIEYIFMKKQEPSTLKFKNCTFAASKAAAAGVGAGSEATVLFEHCDFITSSSDADSFFGHNNPDSNAFHQKLTFINCTFQHKVQLRNIKTLPVITNTFMEAEFLQCDIAEPILLIKEEQKMITSSFVLPATSSFQLETDGWKIKNDN